MGRIENTFGDIFLDPGGDAAAPDTLGRVEPFAEDLRHRDALRAVTNSLAPQKGGRDRMVFRVGSHLLHDRSADGGAWLFYMGVYLRRVYSGRELATELRDLPRKLENARKRRDLHWLLYGVNRPWDTAWENPRVRPLISFLDLVVPSTDRIDEPLADSLVARVLARSDFDSLNLQPSVVRHAIDRVLRERVWRRGTVSRLVVSPVGWRERAESFASSRASFRSDEVLQHIGATGGAGDRVALGRLLRSMGFSMRRSRLGTLYTRTNTQPGISAPPATPGTLLQRLSARVHKVSRRATESRAEGKPIHAACGEGASILPTSDVSGAPPTLLLLYRSAHRRQSAERTRQPLSEQALLYQRIRTALVRRAAFAKSLASARCSWQAALVARRQPWQTAPRSHV